GVRLAGGAGWPAVGAIDVSLRTVGLATVVGDAPVAVGIQAAAPGVAPAVERTGRRPGRQPGIDERDRAVDTLRGAVLVPVATRVETGIGGDAQVDLPPVDRRELRASLVAEADVLV